MNFENESLAMANYFQYSHLPPHLQEISKPFCELADKLLTSPSIDGGHPQLYLSLTLLLQAKDAAVRARIG